MDLVSPIVLWGDSIASPWGFALTDYHLDRVTFCDP